MSFFDLLRPLMTDPNDKIGKATDGIISGNSMILDGSDGTLYAKPNVPKIKISPSLQERMTKSEAYRSGNRGIITNPIDPVAAFGGQVNGKGSPIDEKTLISNPPTNNYSIPTNLGDSPSADSINIPDSNGIPMDTAEGIINGNTQGNPLTTNTGGKDNSLSNNLMSALLNKQDTPKSMDALGASGSKESNSIAETLASKYNIDNPSGMDGSSSANTENSKVSDNGIPLPPVMDKLIDKAKDSPKWKDILVSILNSVGSTDFSHYRPDQQLGALIGAIGGGAGRGALTGRYAGKMDMENKNRSIQAANDRKNQDYNTNIELLSKRQNVLNNADKPILARENLELKRDNQEIVKQRDAVNEMYKQGQLTSKEKDYNLKLSNSVLQNKKFEASIVGYKDTKTVKDQSGDGYSVVGINKATGKPEYLTYPDGSRIKVSDPDYWKSFSAAMLMNKEQARVEGDIAENSVKPPTAAQRQTLIDNQLSANPKYSAIKYSDKRQDKILAAKMEADAASQVDKDIDQTIKRTGKLNNAKVVRRVLNTAPKVSSDVRSKVGRSVSGIDYSKQFSSRQQ